MPKYRFKWINLPDGMLRELCKDLYLDVGDPAESLRAAYGARPTEEFIREAWPSLLERWLGKDGEARRLIVAELWGGGLGSGVQPKGRATEMEFLRSRNNAKGLRQTVWATFIAWGEDGGETAAGGGRGDAAQSDGEGLNTSTSTASLGPDASKTSEMLSARNGSAARPPVRGKNLANFVWSIADQLRGVYKPAQYGSVILPLTILRRMDCVLEPVKVDLLAEAARITNPDQFDFIVRKKFGLNFSNTSAWDFGKLAADPTGLKANLVDYINRFSANVADIFDRFKFENQIATLDEKDRLFLVVQKFAEIDLHPRVLSNADMGALFEELIRKFAEASNETAGEHFTPRDAIHLMADLLLAADDEALSVPGTVRSVYDPTAGTGGMLSVIEEHLLERNPAARLVLYGQEINDESYAICKSDLIGKGQDAGNIQLGDTLRDDKFAGQTFDYCMSNPPYGVDWKAAQADVTAEAAKFGAHGRFGHGLPGISDGQMLFLSHLAFKMRPLKDGGGRAGIVLNGSPLFTGRAGSGESEIRRWLLESDLVDAIVALPTDMFYNTGIATYIWILDNDKPADRLGKVLLIDGTSFWSKMRKGLGSKRKELTETDRDKIVKLYDEYADGEHSRVLPTSSFGYRTITVERPLRLNFAATPERLDAAFAERAVAKLPDPEQAALRTALTALGTEVVTSRDEFSKLLGEVLGNAGITLTAPVRKAVLMGLSERDETAEICRDGKGNPEPDTSLRDTENVPLDDDIHAYFEREVLPHVPDAWIDQAKTKTGYEIPFSRIFYRYVPPRPLEEIDADLNELVAEIIGLLQEVEQ